MRRLAAVLMAAAAFALGAAATQALKTYPYVEDKLNEPCNKTVFEWNLASGRIDGTAAPLDANFDLAGFVGEAKAEALVVQATLAPKARAPAGANDTRWHQTISGAVLRLEQEVSDRFGTSMNQENIIILVRVGDRLAAIRGAHGMVDILPPNATREQQLEALSRALPRP